MVLCQVLLCRPLMPGTPNQNDDECKGYSNNPEDPELWRDSTGYRGIESEERSAEQCLSKH